MLPYMVSSNATSFGDKYHGYYLIATCATLFIEFNQTKTKIHLKTYIKKREKKTMMTRNRSDESVPKSADQHCRYGLTEGQSLSTFNANVFRGTIQPHPNTPLKPSSKAPSLLPFTFQLSLTFSFPSI